ncbi:MAG: TSUP family transporter, partial [Geminicoccaceae bacterium]|nr:TSUP family transporter [Geminicoccaceae bacterium]
LISVPFLVMIDPLLVPAPFLFASLVLALLMVVRDRIAIDVGEIKVAVVGLVIGTAVGAGTLLVVSKDNLPELFGGLILLAVAISAFGLRARIGRASLLTAGAIGGVMGTMGGVHGPAMILLYQGQSGARVRASLGAFFVFGYTISLVGLWLIGLFDGPAFLHGVALCPGILVGWLMAPLLIRRLDATRLRPIILIVSAVAALLLLIGG